LALECRRRDRYPCDQSYGEHCNGRQDPGSIHLALLSDDLRLARSLCSNRSILKILAVSISCIEYKVRRPRIRKVIRRTPDRILQKPPRATSSDLQLLSVWAASTPHSRPRIGATVGFLYTRPRPGGAAFISSDQRAWLGSRPLAESCPGSAKTGEAPPRPRRLAQACSRWLPGDRRAWRFCPEARSPASEAALPSDIRPAGSARSRACRGRRRCRARARALFGPA